MKMNASGKQLSVTAVICTCNREEMLRRSLEGVGNLHIPESIEFKVIVVDNNSEDHTEQVVREFQRSGKLNIHYVKETQQGLSFARNRGIKESDTTYVIFWDDDAIPVKDYLYAFSEGLIEYPNVKAFGGKIIAVYENKPEWFITEGPYKFKGILGAYNLGENSRILTNEDDLPVGANMIFRKDVFDNIDVFNTNLGRRKGSRYILGGEETELLNKIKGQGNCIGYLSETIVHHYVDISRFNIEYLKKVYLGAGIGQGKTININHMKMLFGIPRYLIRDTVEVMIRILWYYVIGKHKVSLYYRTRLWIIIGMVKYFKCPNLID